MELIEEHVRAVRAEGAGAVESPERYEDDEWVTDDEEQRTAISSSSILKVCEGKPHSREGDAPALPGGDMGENSSGAAAATGAET